MYKFVIDTDSEKLSSVNVYADKDKTKRIAAPLDAVGRFAQTVEVAFIGSRKPSASDSLQLVVSWDGTIDSILQSSDETPQHAYIAHAGTPLEGEPDTWTFPVRFESAALEAALAKRSKITLRGAIVVENEAAGTHVEYHFSVGAAASIFAGAIADPQTAPIEFARVLRMSWADYQTLDAIDPDVIYIVEDAPSLLELHNASSDAHKALFNIVLEKISSQIEGHDADEKAHKALFDALRAALPADNSEAIVAIQEAIAPLLTAVLAQYEDPNINRGSNERHGKVIFATSDTNGDGGFYIGGSQSTRPKWTQWLTRILWDKIRAYGNTNGVFEDYVFTPNEDGSNAEKQIARKQDLRAFPVGFGLDVNAREQIEVYNEEGYAEFSYAVPQNGYIVAENVDQNTIVEVTIDDVPVYNHFGVSAVPVAKGQNVNFAFYDVVGSSGVSAWFYPLKS